jgi:predicted CoA-substrate-specific enzyme activase
MHSDTPSHSLFAGLDAGSTSIKLIITDGEKEYFSAYRLHHGDHFGTIAAVLSEASKAGISSCRALCATGSGRKLAGRITGADHIKNEITATWRAVSSSYPDTRTIIEIGGQDSKLITLEDGEISGFRLNSVCAAGTGSFIQQQAGRLGVSIEDLSALSASASGKARFTGRCTVFAETEMVNLQQRGFSVEAIAAGLADAVCENYLKDLSPGMALHSPYVFCGGVAGIPSVVNAFRERLSAPISIPPFYRTAAAFGAALLAMDMNTADHDRPLSASRQNAMDTGKPCSGTDCLNCGGCSLPPSQ